MEENRAISMEAEEQELSQEEALRRELERMIGEAGEAWMEQARAEMRRMQDEAQDIAQMNDEERAAYALEQRAAELDAREREILRRELRAKAARMIEERGLPQELAEAVDCASEERMQASLDAVERAFRCAVQRGVERRMRGEIPAIVRRDATQDESDDAYYSARRATGKRL